MKSGNTNNGNVSFSAPPPSRPQQGAGSSFLSYPGQNNPAPRSNAPPGVNQNVYNPYSQRPQMIGNTQGGVRPYSQFNYPVNPNPQQAQSQTPAQNQPRQLQTIPQGLPPASFSQTTPTPPIFPPGPPPTNQQYPQPFSNVFNNQQQPNFQGQPNQQNFPNFQANPAQQNFQPNQPNFQGQPSFQPNFQSGDVVGKNMDAMSFGSANQINGEPLPKNTERSIDRSSFGKSYEMFELEMKELTGYLSVVWEKEKENKYIRTNGEDIDVRETGLFSFYVAAYNCPGRSKIVVFLDNKPMFISNCFHEGSVILSTGIKQVDKGAIIKIGVYPESSAPDLKLVTQITVCNESY